MPDKEGKPCSHCQWWENWFGKPENERPHETFRFVHIEWDVHEAKEIIRLKPRAPVQIPLTSLRELVDYPQKAGMMDLMKVSVLAEHVPHVDCDRPCIVGFFPPDTPVIRGKKRVPADGVQAPRKRAFIDGHHRIARAIDTNRDSLLAYMLTEEESDYICYVAGSRVSRTDPVKALRSKKKRIRKAKE